MIPVIIPKFAADKAREMGKREGVDFLESTNFTATSKEEYSVTFRDLMTKGNRAQRRKAFAILKNLKQKSHDRKQR